ncbi:hypothetical protein EYF80_000139 [Liparis tanakae]|uniref:Uncharacterized protein n=1 Tax=Liparis tanakae TaxID=230148 RepID=A0A4Z2JGW9_9TELE|nr:hypothetical protein EYF80_000139 [Liparis tanakae]
MQSTDAGLQICSYAKQAPVAHMCGSSLHLSPHMCSSWPHLSPHMCSSSLHLSPHMCSSSLHLSPHMCISSLHLSPHMCGSSLHLSPQQMCISSLHLSPHMCSSRLVSEILFTCCCGDVCPLSSTVALSMVLKRLLSAQQASQPASHPMHAEYFIRFCFCRWLQNQTRTTFFLRSSFSAIAAIFSEEGRG